MYKKVLASLLLVTVLIVTSCDAAPTNGQVTTSPADSSSASSTTAIHSTAPSATSGDKITEDSSMTEASEKMETTVTEPTIDTSNLGTHTFDEATMFNPYGYAVVGEKKDGVMKYGIINEAGIYVIQPEYEAFRTPKSEISFYVTDLDIGYTWLQKDGLWGFVDEKCEWVLDPVYEDCTCFSSFGMAGIMVDGKWGFVSTTGELVVDPAYDDVMMDERENYVQVRKDSLWGLIDKTGKEVVAPMSSSRILTEGTYGENGYWEIDGENLALINGATKLITMDGRVIYEGTSFSYGSIGPNHLFYGDSATLGNGYFNLNGDLVIPLADDEFGLTFSEDGVAIVVTQGENFKYTYRYIDESGNPISDKEFSSAANFSPNGLACVQIDDKYGYIDTSGAFVIEPQFVEAYDFFEAGLACVIVDAKFGYIDKTGAFIIEPIYDEGDTYISNSYIEVKLDGKAALVDAKGTLLTGFDYDWIWSRPLSDEDENSPVFSAGQEGKEGLIDVHGNWILPPQYDVIGTSTLFRTGY